MLPRVPRLAERWLLINFKMISCIGNIDAGRTLMHRVNYAFSHRRLEREQIVPELCARPAVLAAIITAIANNYYLSFQREYWIMLLLIVN